VLTTFEAIAEGLPSSDMSKLTKIISVSLALLLLTVERAPAATPALKPLKPVCRLEVQNAHLSTTLQKHQNIRAVKVNVYLICNIFQTHVQIFLEIHKTGELGDGIYGPFVNEQSPKTNSGLEVSLQDKSVTCKNTIMTKWYGIAYSKAFISGKWLYAGRTQSQKIVPLPCGT